MSIFIHNPHNFKNIPQNQDFAEWIEAALSTPMAYECGICLVDPLESASLNEQFRKKNNATNILAFPCGETDPSVENPLTYLGDLAICPPVVEKEAMAQNKSPIAHWAHLVVHGTLHLQGYDHQSTEEAKEMEALEITILAKLNYPNPYEI